MSIANKLQAVAQNQQKVYDAGKTAGESADVKTAYEQGYGAGTQTEYDRFWDSYQENGSRTGYVYGFAGRGWTDETFKPKYPIKPGLGDGMFRNTQIKDIPAALAACCVTLDFSNCTSFAYMFMYSLTQYVGEIDTRSCGSLSATFYYAAQLVSIEKLILKTAGTQSFSTTFNGCSALTEICIEGVIGSDISFIHSPLSKKSLQSVIAALSDTADGKTATFHKTAADTAFETAEGAADGSTSEEWLTLVAAKPNWTISLT